MHLLPWGLIPLPLAAHVNFFPCVLLKGKSTVNQLWDKKPRVVHIVGPPWCRLVISQESEWPTVHSEITVSKWSPEVRGAIVLPDPFSPSKPTPMPSHTHGPSQTGHPSPLGSVTNAWFSYTLHLNVSFFLPAYPLILLSPHHIKPSKPRLFLYWNSSQIHPTQHLASLYMVNAKSTVVPLNGILLLCE